MTGSAQDRNGIAVNTRDETDDTPVVAAPERHPPPPDGLAGIARLELDELVGQLIARATDVLDTQARLRGLRRPPAVPLARGTDLDDLLTHILDAARTLVGARHAALGVVEAGRLARFLRLGIDAAGVAIENAVLSHESRRREQWQAAIFAWRPAGDQSPS